MTVTAIVGANWGDEGKGKMTDVLAEGASYVVRFQGGSNAGHTILNRHGKFALRLLPSGVFHPNATNVIGPGTALDVEVLLQELSMLEERGVPAPRLRVSDRAQLVLPAHRLLDELEEGRLGEGSFGSTKRGIAPFYADKYAKIGVQAADLFDEPRLRSRIERQLESKNVLFRHLYGREPLRADDAADALLAQAERLRPYVCDASELLYEAVRRGESVLLEGQLGALRDPDHGIYPYSTSSSPLAGFASVGAGLPAGSIANVLAVTKAYSSCVGAGPFATELSGSAAEELRRRGGDAGEYGAVTGRPRRVGWFDAVATRYGCRLQGATEVALTNLDVLGYLDRLPVCTAYRLEDGRVVGRFPTTGALEKAAPVLETLDGWLCDIADCRTFEALPPAARRYVEFVESSIGVPVSYVSVGPRREQLIRRR
ncbi:adenylosuccinate synthase [Paenibacillus antri]|uniref:Adenylosuccinate synthetase n=1 Tax=Paenibacillus antri TaxID=2582848 RepID=A0A5R9GE20_9BACL|nr:adenylosuccinate synthase [Paenibacillus antri]TLS49625.1 adenylosuccinate synthase [Paenibacillus antri]